MKKSAKLVIMLIIVIALLVVYFLLPKSETRLSVHTIDGEWALHTDCPNTIFTFLGDNKLQLSSCDGEYTEEKNKISRYEIQGDTIVTTFNGDTYEFAVAHDNNEAKLKLLKKGQTYLFSRVERTPTVSTIEEETTTSTTTTSETISAEPETTTGDMTSVSLRTDLRFTFKDYEGMQFKIISVKKVYDPKADYNHFAKGIQNPALVTVEMQITNNADKKLNANYLQIIYNDGDNTATQTRVAPYYINTSYQIDSLSSSTISPTFIIPDSQIEVSLVTGIYQPIIYESAEQLLSQSTDAFLVNFKEKTAWHPEG